MNLYNLLPWEVNLRVNVHSDVEKSKTGSKRREEAAQVQKRRRMKSPGKKSGEEETGERETHTGLRCE